MCVQNIETIGAKKSLCKAGSVDVDMCAQRNPKKLCAVNSLAP
jgi:hypothetical protein